MPSPRLQGSFDEGLDLLGRTGYPVMVRTARGHLTLTRWSEEVMSAWLQYHPRDRGEPDASHADAHAILFLDDDTWRIATDADGVPANPLCGPSYLSFTEDAPGGRSGRRIDSGPTREAMHETLEEGIAALNRAFSIEPRLPGPR